MAWLVPNHTVAIMKVRATYIVLLSLALTCLATSTSLARPPASCEFDPESATLFAGRDNPDFVAIRRHDREILVDGESCGATVKNTDTILVFGSSRSFGGEFHFREGLLQPGRTAEQRGASEIEVELVLNEPEPEVNGAVSLHMSPLDDTVIVTPHGIDLNGDGDADIVLDRARSLSIVAGRGADTVTMNAAGASRTSFPFAFVHNVLLGRGRDIATFTGVSPERGYFIQGAHGDDRLSTDSGSGWSLLGQAGDDILTGGSGDDYFQTGVGSDIVRGHGGSDRVGVFGRDDEPDVFSGGSGLDSISINQIHRYSVSVTLDGVANDGGAGEQDQILPDFENVATYVGNDVLIGDADANLLDAGRGNDTIDGGAGEDDLRGGAGRDDIAGGSGRDAIHGGTQRDVFHTTDGELDRIRGGNGYDTATDRDAIDRLHGIEAF
jgi:hypothetical protein